MGRTPVPLVIWVDSDWLTHPRIVALAAKGHTVVDWYGDMMAGRVLPPPDLHLSRVGHWWSDDMWSYLDAALRRARERKRAASGGT